MRVTVEGKDQALADLEEIAIAAIGANDALDRLAEAKRPGLRQFFGEAARPEAIFAELKTFEPPGLWLVDVIFPERPVTANRTYVFDERPTIEWVRNNSMVRISASEREIELSVEGHWVGARVELSKLTAAAIEERIR